MKIIFSLLIIVFTATPLFAEQALVLTEIEQIQEKIWYLQRDIAAQKSTLEKHQSDYNALHATIDKKGKETDQKLGVLTNSLNDLYEKNELLATSLQSLKEAVANLNDEFSQQNNRQMQQAEKSGTQQDMLLELRNQITANQANTEKTLAETEQQLTETKEQLTETKEQLAAIRQQSGHLDQIGLYLGGAALALAILLTIAFTFLNSRTKTRYRDMGKHPDHEL